MRSLMLWAVLRFIRWAEGRLNQMLAWALRECSRLDEEEQREKGRR